MYLKKCCNTILKKQFSAITHKIRENIYSKKIKKKM